jgi:D-serine deaminase-like pyridoxal phosphate-dependent protein
MNKMDLDTPVAIVDLRVMEVNIERMAGYARKSGISLRPHVKSHKIPAVAQRQVDAGAVGITVAKIGEAETMVRSGIRDVLIAYPIVGTQKVERLVNLCDQARLAVAVDHSEPAEALSDAFLRRKLTIDVLVIVELGFNRCGVSPGRWLLEMVKKISKLRGLRFRGIMGYAGQVYAAENWDEVANIGREEGRVLADTAGAISRDGFPVEVVSAGSTPSARIVGSIPGITEIRPGAYIFNDRVEMAMGVAKEEDCALRVITTVVSRPTAERAVIDAGDKVLSQDRGLDRMTGFGLVVGRPDIEVERLNEEHGILRLSHRDRKIRIGEKLEIIPNHVCPVCNLVDQIVGIRNDQVESVLPVLARGKVT